MNTNEKKISIANFNTVFQDEDEEEKPLLEYFDTILMPALKSDIRKDSADSSYFFMNIQIIEDPNSDYVLTGCIVKKTVLERYSDIDIDGKLIEKDDRYSAAPYSVFAIYLRNHRMIFIENQKGSPRLSNFRSAVKYVIDTFVKRRNEELKKEQQKCLPIPLVNVVGIPSKQGIKEKLEALEKINSVKLRFYPLNGDGDDDLSEVLNSVTKKIPGIMGSRTGSITYNSPQNKDGVIDFISRTNGIVEPTIKGRDKNNGERVIRNDEISESKIIKLNGDLKSEIDQCVKEGLKFDSIKHTSEQNKDIYEKNKTKIIPFIKKKR